MDNHRMDELARTASAGAPRRRVLLGLGGLAVGALGLLATREDAVAGCRKKCRRRCENRGPKCQDRCEKRLCD